MLLHFGGVVFLFVAALALILFWRSVRDAFTAKSIARRWLWISGGIAGLALVSSTYVIPHGSEILRMGVSISETSASIGDARVLARAAGGGAGGGRVGPGRPAGRVPSRPRAGRLVVRGRGGGPYDH